MSEIQLCTCDTLTLALALHLQIKRFEDSVTMSDYGEPVDSEPPTIDPYDTLDLERDATADQIKSAYRKAALKNHPGMST